MKEIVILVLSVSLVSVFASTANAMRSFLAATDTAEPALIDSENDCALTPIVADQPPEDEEHWPGCRD
ncbi:hypothetical protein HRE53_12440 [Acaryochloris sp. 'Moss Beach']|uniref:hypothetical protein n=1 Tax=Acaryochloris sp. 'Moss Beach' TaxID=2740837 RepID=UPI001F2BAD7C|nr:hypothetical protein [Acaryochloris sp. 'Moss Beach']UJB71688.1 hypothetical protein HRE53_12440 [Acaryochloris sp. 'Moss Beach']